MKVEVLISGSGKNLLNNRTYAKVAPAVYAYLGVGVFKKRRPAWCSKVSSSIRESLGKFCGKNVEHKNRRKNQEKRNRHGRKTEENGSILSKAKLLRNSVAYLVLRVKQRERIK
jgi:hypothetical protein